MLRVFFVFIPFFFPPIIGILACSKDKPIAPAGKIVSQAEVPSEPTNLRIEAITDTSARVHWDAVEGATDYDVNYKKAIGGRWTNEPHKGTRYITQSII